MKKRAVFILLVLSFVLLVAGFSLSDYTNKYTGYASQSSSQATIGLIIEGVYCGDDSCSGNETCSNCPADCGSCPVITPAPSAGGGGGGAPSKIPIKGEDIFIGNKFIDVIMGLNSIKTREISLYNQADEVIRVKLNLGELGREGILFVNKEDLEFDLAPRTSKVIDVTIIAPKDTGVYNGIIKVKGKAEQEIQVSIVVSEQELLFDVELIIPWEYKIIKKNSDLPAHLTLIPMAEDIKLDVKTNYVIKNFEGRSFYQESKTFSISGTWNEDKIFPTRALNLLVGQYILELELEYPYPNRVGVAVSRSSFEVREPVVEWPGIFYDYRFILLLIIISVLLLIIEIILIIRKHKKIKEQIRIKG